MNFPTLPATTLTLALTCAACGGKDYGTLRLTTWGEEYAETGIGEEEFADGFAVQFEHFFVVLGDVRAVQGGETFVAQGTQLVDLVPAGPHELGSHFLSAGHWTAVEYSIVPLTGDTRLHPSASDAARSLMAAGPYSVYVAGEATRGGDSFRFAWGFSSSTRYQNCEQEDGAPGFSVGTEAATTVELTLHVDHLFYDDLADDEAVLRFEPLAGADANDDGLVTLEELAAVPLIDLPPGSYGTGNHSHVDDLRAFVSAQVSALGHFEGEGHCRARLDP